MNSNRLGCYCAAGKNQFLNDIFVLQIFVQNWFFISVILPDTIETDQTSEDRLVLGGDKMKIEKVINNNVVSALEDGREVVVMGKGIGFQLRAGMDIPEELIEKVFRLDNPGVMDQFKNLVQKLPPERLQISAEVIQYAKGVMNKN